MKKYCVSIVFLFTTVWCWGQDARLIVKTESETKTLRYRPVNGIQLPFYDLSTEISAGPDHTVEFSLPATESLYNITIGTKNINVHVSSGSCDTVFVSEDSLIFQGDNKSYNQYLEAAGRSDQYCRDYSRNRRRHELAETNDLADFKSLIASRKSTDNRLLEEGRFSEQFIKQQQHFTDLRYYALFLKKIISLQNASGTANKWLEEFNNRKLPLCDSDSRPSEWFHEILKDYVCIRRFLSEKLDPKNVMDSFNTFLFDNYSKILSGKDLEYAWAYLLYYDIFQEEYSKDILSLYDRFADLFPGSSYTSLLAPNIKRYTDLYQGDNRNENIRIMEYENEPESIEDILRPFAGKPVYIDIWATTCAPCLKSFSQLDNLKEKIKGSEEEPVFFYISLDQDRNAEKWKKMIDYYKLEGYHYRINKQTGPLIYKTFGDAQGMLMIPRYVIVDKNGKIVFPDAASPYEPDQVAEQLKPLLK